MLGILTLFLLVVLFIFIICFIISAVQFCIDLHKCSDLRKDMQDTISLIKTSHNFEKEESEVNNDE